MSVNITWTWGPMITQDTDTLSGVVTGIHWMCLALDSDSDANGKVSGILDVTLADTDNFVALDQVTNDIVQGWISSGINKSSIEEQCLSYIKSAAKTNMVSVPLAAES